MAWIAVITAGLLAEHWILGFCIGKFLAAGLVAQGSTHWNGLCCLDWNRRSGNCHLRNDSLQGSCIDSTNHSDRIHHCRRRFVELLKL